MKKIVVFFCLAILLINSCSIFRDDMQTLTHNKWRLKSLTVSPAYLGETDLYAQLPECKKDDFINFEYESVLVANEGDTKCNANDPQTVNSYWHMNDDKTELMLYNDTTSTTYQVINIDRNSLELETTYDEDVTGNGELTTFTLNIEYKDL